MSADIKKEIFSWIKTILLALVLAWAVNNFVVVNATVPTGSMENTIMPNDRIIAFRLSYLTKEPQRGDIVIFRYPDDPTGETLYVKRVMGLPGDTIEVISGAVYVNGSKTPLAESYLKEQPLGDFGPYEVPEGTYFMMGDNRNSSLDSRYWHNTFVEKKEILGKVICRYYKGFKMIQ